MEKNTKSKRKRLMVIDGHALVHRAYHALPRLTTKNGDLVNSVYGFFLIFLKAVRELKPDFVVATFDVPGPTFRHDKYEDYKATRPKVPEELSDQIPKIKEILSVFNIPVFEKAGFEADDLIGTISTLAPRKQVIPELETIIVSGDLDNLQLVDNNTKVYTLRRGLKDTILYDKKAIKERYGLSPRQLVDFKALKGDPSDNIPGVPGIGKKTAAKLLLKFDNLENLYKALEKRSEEASSLKGRLREKLLEYKDQAFFSQTLAKIKRNVEIDFNLKKCRWNKYDKKKVIQLFKKFEFTTLIKRLSDSSSKNGGKNENRSSIGNNLKLW